MLHIVSGHTLYQTDSDYYSIYDSFSTSIFLRDFISFIKFVHTTLRQLLNKRKIIIA